MVKSKKIRKIILDIAEKIKKNYNPEKIILFGSFAHGKPTRHSDIDMLIVKRTKKKSIGSVVYVKKVMSRSRERNSFYSAGFYSKGA